MIAGASDADPTTVATLAVVGAATAYRLGWLVLLLFPMIAVIQVIATDAGLASGRDLQGMINGRPVLRWLVLVSVLAVNVVTIAADLEGGAAALGLLLHADWRWFVPPLAAVPVAVLLLAPFRQALRVLQAFTLCLLGYAVAVFFAHPDWGAVAHGTFVPSLRWDGPDLTDALALLGTTLTSYVYIWQTIGQAEEPVPWSHRRPRRTDAVAGAFFATAVFWCILVTTGATLGVHHRSVGTAAQAAQALEPLAGPAAGALFGAGLLASALVALPVLFAVSGYVPGSGLNWQASLSLRARRAPGFYAVLAAVAAAGAAIAVGGTDPIRLLFIASIIGGIATPAGLVALLLAAGDGPVLRDRLVSPWLRAAGWAVTCVITAVSLAYLAQQVIT